MNTDTPHARRRFLADLLGCCGLALAGRTRAADAELATPAPLLLASVGAPGPVDPAGYLVSEKLDGVRAVWDGRRLRFRSGRAVPAPAWFVGRLPPRALDGELWAGRRRFDRLSGTVRSDPPDDAAWREVRFMVFELPDAPGTFAERAAAIEQLVRDTGWPALQAVAQRPVADAATLRRLLDATVGAGGEGLMLHLASAPYSTGRSDTLIKIKPALDSEAIVVAHRAGKGRLAGQLGALQLETPEGRRFWLGSGFSDAQRRDPPPIGATVTYRYRELTPAGLPRFASFVQVRESF